MRSFAVRIALAALALLLGEAAVAARQFRAADNQQQDYPTVQALLYFDRVVRQRTSGRHSITVFHSRQLGEEADTIAQTRVGAIDINRTNVAPLADMVPELNALSIPFLFASPAHLYRVLDGPVGEEILKSLEAQGLIGLAFYDSGARSFYNALRPVRAPADMRGLRIRVQQSEIVVEMVRALGATPVVLPYGQVGVALTTRVVDGAENNWPSYVSTGHFRTARFITLTEHTQAPEVVVMSRRAWDSLSPEDQAVFREAARESALFMRDLWVSWEEEARREAREAGSDVTSEFDRAAFEAAVAPVAERFLQDPRTRALAERIRALR